MSEASSRDDFRYDIQQVAESSGYTVRNIRAYLQLGILPAATKIGRKLYFSVDHLDRLAWIGECRDRGYSLAAIRDIVDGTIHLGEDDVGSSVLDLRDSVARSGGGAGDVSAASESRSEPSGTAQEGQP